MGDMSLWTNSSIWLVAARGYYGVLSDAFLVLLPLGEIRLCCQSPKPGTNAERAPELKNLVKGMGMTSVCGVVTK